MTFDNLGLDANMLQTIEKQGFTKPTLIQEKTIPLILAGKDVIGGSSTGSGKTLAFASGIIQNGKKGSLQAIVLVPTREIAIQITEVFKKLIYNGMSVVTVYGGVSIEKQINDLKTADIVIATPGRALDHLGRRTMNLKDVKTVVLDEADRMADMGFIDDVTEILGHCQAKEQTLLFSATISQDIKQIAKQFMKNPVSVFAERQVDASKLKQTYYNTNSKLKISLLVHLLKTEQTGLVMVFCNKRSTADFVSKQLSKNNLNSSAIHGGLTQARRTSTLEKFHSNKVEILVCTDVAARGLDIPFVSHVYNFECPPDAKDYVHRIGRTARAGSEGKVINLIADTDYDNFSKVMYDYKEFTIERIETPFVEQAIIAPMPRSDSRGRGNFRGGDSRGGFRRQTGNPNAPSNFRGGSGNSRGHSGGNSGRRAFRDNDARDNDARPAYGGRDNDSRPQRSYGGNQNSYGGNSSRGPRRNNDSKDSNSRPTTHSKTDDSKPSRSFSGDRKAHTGSRRPNKQPYDNRRK